MTVINLSNHLSNSLSRHGYLESLGSATFDERSMFGGSSTMFEDTMSVQSYSARGNLKAVAYFFELFQDSSLKMKTNLVNLLADRHQIHRLSEQVEDETDGDKVNK